MIWASSSKWTTMYAWSAALNWAILLGVMNAGFPEISPVTRKYALQPIPSTCTSYASPSPESYTEHMASGFFSFRRDSQSPSPGMVAETGRPGFAECLSNVQSACGLLCHGHHTVSTAPINDATAPAHAAITDPSMKVSPTLWPAFLTCGAPPTLGKDQTMLEKINDGGER